MDVVVADVPANLADYQLVDRFRVEDGRVFLSGLQAVARLPVDQLRIDRRHGLNTAAFVSGYQGSPVGTFQEEVSRSAACRARPAAGGAPRSQRGAGGDVGDGQPARRLAPREALRRRARRVVRQGARASTAPTTPSATPCSPAPPTTAAWSPWSATTRRRSRRRCPARATPRWSTCTCRSSSPATCRRRSTSPATPWRCRGPAACGSATSSSPRSPTAPAPSTSTPTASCRWCRRWSTRVAPSSRTRAGACSRRTPSTWSASSRRCARCSPASTASSTSSTASRSAPRTTGSASPRAGRPTTSCARRCRCSGSRATSRCGAPASACCSCRCRCRSTRTPCASSPTASARCSWSRRRTRRSSCS